MLEYLPPRFVGKNIPYMQHLGMGESTGDFRAPGAVEHKHAAAGMILKLDTS